MRHFGLTIYRETAISGGIQRFWAGSE